MKGQFDRAAHFKEIKTGFFFPEVAGEARVCVFLPPDDQEAGLFEEKPVSSREEFLASYPEFIKLQVKGKKEEESRVEEWYIHPEALQFVTHHREGVDPIASVTFLLHEYPELAEMPQTLPDNLFVPFYVWMQSSDASYEGLTIFRREHLKDLLRSGELSGVGARFIDPAHVLTIMDIDQKLLMNSNEFGNVSQISLKPVV